MLLTIDQSHVLMRHSIVLGHRGTVGVERIEHPRGSVYLDIRYRWHRRVTDLLLDEIPYLLVRLGPIMGPIATGHRRWNP